MSICFYVFIVLWGIGFVDVYVIFKLFWIILFYILIGYLFDYGFCVYYIDVVIMVVKWVKVLFY